MAVSNKNLAWPGGMLETWVTNVRRAGVPNAMIIALDDETKAAADKLGFPAFRMDVPVGGVKGAQRSVTESALGARQREGSRGPASLTKLTPRGKLEVG